MTPTYILWTAQLHSGRTQLRGTVPLHVWDCIAMADRAPCGAMQFALGWGIMAPRRAQRPYLSTVTRQRTNIYKLAGSGSDVLAVWSAGRPSPLPSEIAAAAALPLSTCLPGCCGRGAQPLLTYSHIADELSSSQRKALLPSRSCWRWEERRRGSKRVMESDCTDVRRVQVPAKLRCDRSGAQFARPGFSSFPRSG